MMFGLAGTLVIFAFDEASVADLHQPVQSALGQRDIPFDALPCPIGLPPVSITGISMTAKRNFTAQTISPQVQGAVIHGSELCCQRGTKTPKRQSERRMQRRLG